jgi:curved DNA-binding protein
MSSGGAPINRDVPRKQARPFSIGSSILWDEWPAPPPRLLDIASPVIYKKDSLMAVEFKDYYKTLGVPKTATDKEIKAAYRKLARKHHPDVNQGNKQAEAKFKEINEAYEVLSDPEKRKRYEQVGSDWGSYATRGPSPWGAAPGGGRVRVNVGLGDDDPGGFSEFFRTFFGGGFGGGGVPGGAEGGFGGFDQMPGADLEHPVDLSLDEVLKGATRTLRIGDGGSGRTVEVKIPPGVREGSRVRVAGEGAPGGRSGRKGDLYLRVHVLPHPRFETKDDDLYTAVNVPLTTAVLGGEVEVPTLEGPVGIKVPPETPAGRVFRLRGKGLPRADAGGARGDVMATLGVDLPRSLTDREKELFEELKRSGR